MFVLDTEYRITSRFDPPLDRLLQVPAHSSRLPADVERAVRVATLLWRGDALPAGAYRLIPPDILIYVSQLEGNFYGLAVRVQRAPQMYPIG